MAKRGKKPKTQKSLFTFQCPPKRDTLVVLLPRSYGLFRVYIMNSHHPPRPSDIIASHPSASTSSLQIIFQTENPLAKMTAEHTTCRRNTQQETYLEDDADACLVGSPQSQCNAYTSRNIPREFKVLIRYDSPYTVHIYHIDSKTHTDIKNGNRLTVIYQVSYSISLALKGMWESRVFTRFFFKSTVNSETVKQ